VKAKRVKSPDLIHSARHSVQVNFHGGATLRGFALEDERLMIVPMCADAKELLFGNRHPMTGVYEVSFTVTKKRELTESERS
jgi:hypothetical protein